MPPASLVVYVFSKVFCWGVTCCSPSVQFWQDELKDWSSACHGHTPLRFHFSTMRQTTVSAILSTFTSVFILCANAIAGVSPVSRVCSDMILVRSMTQDGAGALALAWTVHAILYNFQRSIFCRGLAKC